MNKIVFFNKPYNVHSQFRKDNKDMATLADFFNDKTLRVAGRLDKDSEGLLILTDNGTLNHALMTPEHKRGKVGKTYLVQVENTPTQAQLDMLRMGVVLKDGKTLPAKVELMDALPITLWERHPPIRERKNIPTAWLSITIFEGKNRQIRRMTAHVGLPCLRLIRYAVGSCTLGEIGSGQSRTLHLNDTEAWRLFGLG